MNSRMRLSSRSAFRIQAPLGRPLARWCMVLALAVALLAACDETQEPATVALPADTAVAHGYPGPPQPTSTPVPTPQPTATSTPSPTPSPSPTPTPEPTVNPCHTYASADWLSNRLLARRKCRGSAIGARLRRKRQCQRRIRGFDPPASWPQALNAESSGSFWRYSITARTRTPRPETATPLCISRQSPTKTQ